MTRGIEPGQAVPWLLVGGPHEGTVLQVVGDHAELRLIHFGEWVSYRARTYVVGQWMYRIGLDARLDEGVGLDLHVRELIRQVGLAPIDIVLTNTRPGG